MAYTVNGKVYTDHALMDEIVYNCKIILDGIVLKNSKLANYYETDESFKMSDLFVECTNDSVRPSFFPKDMQWQYYVDFGYTKDQASFYCDNPEKIPADEYDRILAYFKQRFLSEYEEENDYYRMLIGLPAFDTSDYNVYLSKEEYGDITSFENTGMEFDYTKPIHEYSTNEITTLDTLGIIDALKDKYITNNKYTASNYRYLNYLGSNRIDLYAARTAEKYDILYIPPVEYNVLSRFQELFATNREIYLRRLDQQAYSVSSEYYDEIIMFMIVCQTFNDMIVDTPEWYIRRDIIDLRSAKYFLDSQGIQFFEDIPLRYQILIVKNMNKLIRYKSTDVDIQNILDIFSADDAVVYNYYLLKRYKKTDKENTIIPQPPAPEEWTMADEYDFGDDDASDIINNTGDGDGNDMEYDPNGEKNELFDFNLDEIPSKLFNYDFGNLDSDEVDDTEETDEKEEQNQSDKVIKDSNDNIYDLEFIKVPISENYDDYIKDPLYRVDYDAVTAQDRYWDGQDVHSYIKNQHLNREFTIEDTKFMGIEYNTSMSEYTYEREYYLGMIFNNKIKLDDITISVPSIKQNAYFNLRNIFLFLYCCNGLYSGEDINVNNPLDALEKRTDPKPEFNAYGDEDGGHPWDRGNYDGPIDPDEPIPVWELPSLDFGALENEDDGVELYYDFGEVGDSSGNIDEIYNYGIMERQDENGNKIPPEIDTIATDIDFGDLDNIDVYDDDDDSVKIIVDYGIMEYEDSSDPEEYDYGPMDLEYYDDDDEDDKIAYDDPDYHYKYDAIITVNEINYKTFLGCYYIDQETGDYTQITENNAADYIGQTITIRYKWYNILPSELTEDADGHGPYGQIWDMYHDVINGGDIRYSAELTKASYYDYIRTDHPYIFKTTYGRIYGFNMNVNLDKLREDIGFRHSQFGFKRGYTLEDLGCDTFIVQTEFHDLKELYNVYVNNTKCYNNLTKLIEGGSTRDEKRVYDYVFNSLFTTVYDSDFYTLANGDMAKTYDQVLKKYDYTLYKKYEELMSEPDPDTRTFNVRNILNDIVDTLNYYISGDNLKYVLTFVYTNSLDAKLHYIYEMMNFFKSWKVNFLDSKVVYRVDDKSNHKITYGDQLEEMKVSYHDTENVRLRDSIFIKPTYTFEEYKDLSKDDFNHKASVVDLASHYMDDDIFADRLIDFNDDIEDDEVYDGGNITEQSTLPVSEFNGGNLGYIYEKELKDLDGGKPVIRDDFNDFDGKGPNERSKESKENFTAIECGRANIRYIPSHTTITEVDELNNVKVHARINQYPTNGLENRKSWDGEPPVWPFRNLDFGELPEKNSPNTVVYEFGDMEAEKDGIEIGDEDNGEVRLYDFGEITETSVDTNDSDALIADSGLYFDTRLYTLTSDIENSIAANGVYAKETTDLLIDLYRTLLIYTDINLARSIITETYESYLGHAIEVVTKLSTTIYDTNIKNTVDEKSDDLRKWFKQNNPYAWGTF